MPGGGASENIHVCGQCGKEGTNLRCKECLLVYYCDRDCQKAHWKLHKPICRLTSSVKNDDAPEKAELDSVSHSKLDGFGIGLLYGLVAALESGSLFDDDYDDSLDFEAFRGATSVFPDTKVWHEGISKEEVYVRLIDSFRLRRDDEYTHCGDICEFYGGGRPMPGFKRYMARAKANKVLPKWWSPAHDSKVKDIAVTHERANINYAVEKHDIVDYYTPLNRPFEVEVLRRLAFEIDGPIGDF